MIAGPTPQSATHVLRDLLQRAVACVTTGRVAAQVTPPEVDLVVDQAMLAPSGRVQISLRHRYLLLHDPTARRDQRWHVRTAGYMYKLDDRDGREAIAYHWHPEGLGPERRPHIHIGAGMGAIRPEWQKAHILIGHVSPTALLILLIEQLGIAPRHAGWPDAFARLDEALDFQ